MYVYEVDPKIRFLTYSKLRLVFRHDEPERHFRRAELLRRSYIASRVARSHVSRGNFMAGVLARSSSEAIGMAFWTFFLRKQNEQLVASDTPGFATVVFFNRRRSYRVGAPQGHSRSCQAAPQRILPFGSQPI